MYRSFKQNLPTLCLYAGLYKIWVYYSQWTYGPHIHATRHKNLWRRMLYRLKLPTRGSRHRNAYPPECYMSNNIIKETVANWIEYSSLSFFWLLLSYFSFFWSKFFFFGWSMHTLLQGREENLYNTNQTLLKSGHN